jgi:hypothetical protein
MKTTVDIADDILSRAKVLAAEQNVTLDSLIEEGLRVVLRRRMRQDKFTLRNAAVDGRGTQAGIAEGDWETIRDVIYDDRA